MFSRQSNNTIGLTVNDFEATELLTIPRYSDTTSFPNVNNISQGSIFYNKLDYKIYYVGASGGSNFYRELSVSSLPPGSNWLNGTDPLYGAYIYTSIPNEAVVIGATGPSTGAKLDVAGGIHSISQISADGGVDVGNERYFYLGNALVYTQATGSGGISSGYTIYTPNKLQTAELITTTLSATTGNIITSNITTLNATSGIFNSLTSNAMSLSGPSSRLLIDNNVNRYIGVDGSPNLVIKNGGNHGIELLSRHVGIGESGVFNNEACLNIVSKKNNANNITIRARHDDTNTSILRVCQPDGEINIAGKSTDKMNFGKLDSEAGVFTPILEISNANSIVNISGTLTINNQPVDFNDEWTRTGNDIYNNNLTGNVGIGKSNPTFPLDVSGSMRVNLIDIPATSDGVRLQPWSATFGGLDVVNNTSTSLFHITDGGDAYVKQSLYVDNNAQFLQTTNPLTINETQSWDGTTLFPTIEANVLLMKNIHIPFGNQIRFAENSSASNYYDIKAQNGGFQFVKNAASLSPFQLMELNDYSLYLEKPSNAQGGCFLGTTTDTGMLSQANDNHLILRANALGGKVFLQSASQNCAQVDATGITLFPGVAKGALYFGDPAWGIERQTNADNTIIRARTGNVEVDLGGDSGGSFTVKNTSSQQKVNIVGRDADNNTSYIKFSTLQGTGQAYIGPAYGGNDMWLASYSGDVYIDAGSGKRTYIDSPVADGFYYNKKEDPSVVRENCIITPVVFVWDGSVVQFGATPTITSITRNSVGYYTITYKMSAAGSFRTCIGARDGIATAFTACDISGETTTDVYTYNNAGTLQDVRTSVIRFVYDNGT